MLDSTADIIIRKLAGPDFSGLLYYLHHLSTETKSRFGPHAFDADSVIQFYKADDVTGLVAVNSRNNSIIAYALIKHGILHYEKQRLSAYNYPGIESNCITYAPSVADEWQGKGIGKRMFEFLLSDCRQKNIKRVILWGGVRSSNKKALHFYKTLGFVTLGQFEYNGLNQDMLLEI